MKYQIAFILAGHKPENQTNYSAAGLMRIGAKLLPVRLGLCGLLALLMVASAQAQAIRLVSAPGNFYGDDKQGNGILNNYAAYAISNNTAVTLPSVYVAITNINATNLIQLAANDPGVRFLGALAPGQVKLAAFYLRGPSLTGSSFSGLTNETHTIQVRNAPIGFGGSLLASASFSYTNINYVLEASANKVTIITNLNPSAVLGSIVPLVIGGQSGTIGSPPTLELSPAVFDNWRPDAYQLERTLVIFDQNPSYTNLLYFDASTPGFTNYANNNYTNTYYFRASKVTGTNVPVSPFGFIASGTQIKHTALSSLSALGPTNSSIMSVTNGTIIGHTVSPAILTAVGGTVTYSIIISNISSSDVQVDRMIDVLPGAPANVTFVNNSATYNAVALTNPVISGQTLTWNLPFAVTANSASVLTFQATVPATGGLYTNSVTGVMGLEQIDTTFDTSDNSPSLSVLGVGSADLAIAKSAAPSVLAGANLTYTISVTNLGPSSASSVTVTDTLPASVSFVSASGAGVNNSGIVTWSLGTLANGQSSNVTVTVTAPASGSLTNTANVASPTADPNSTNNVTPPVTTSVTPVADLAIGKSGPASVVYGSNFNYTISVTNFGPSTASGILVTDTLPANLVFVSAVPAATTNTANEVIWSLADLASGAGTNLTLTVNSLSAGVASNTAKLGSPVSDPNPTNNVTPPVVTTVGQAMPLVTWTNPASIVYGTPLGTNQNNASANVGGTFTYNPTNGTVLPVGTNLLTVLFTPGNTNYATTNVSVTLLVTPAPLTITANSTGKIYGQTVTFAGTEFTTVGLTNGDSVSNVTLTSAGAANTANVGSYAIIPSAAIGSGLANYAITYSTNGTLTVNPATLGITANDTNRLYNTANPTFTYTPSGFLNGDTASVLSGSPSLTTTAILSSPVGSYPINATNGTLSATNYVFAFTNGMLTVLTGSYGIVWTNPAPIVYGTPLGTNENNAVATVPGGYVYNPTNGTVLPVGTNTLSVVFTPTDTNYTATNLSVQLIVTPAPLTITASNQGKVYGQALTLGTTAFTPSGLVNSETIGSVTLASFGAATNAAAGAYAIVPSAATGGTFNPANYSLTYSNGTLTVSQAALTVTANNTNKIYGAVNPTFTASYSGFVNGETAGVLSGAPSLTTTATTNSGVGGYTITATNGALSAANYSFAFVNGTLTVDAATLTITANDTNRLYNTANPIFTYTPSGFVNGETSSVLSGSPSLTTTATISSPGGSYPINATNGTLSAANYNFSFVSGTLTIIGSNYGITWTNPASIVYGTLVGTNENNASATVAGSYDYNPTNGTLLPAGTNTLSVVFTPSDTNYATTNLSVQLVVTPAPLTITANDTNKPYNTTLSLDSTAFTSSGLVNSETIGSMTLASAGTVASAPLGTYPITASNATGGTFSPANYSITYSNGTLTVLGAVYTATWPTPTNIVYGTALGTNENNATASITGTFTYDPTNGVVLPAGTNTLTVLFTPGDTNYAATNLSVPLIVTPAPLTITADDANKVYGTTLTLGSGQTAFTSSGLVNGDSVTSVTLASAGAASVAPVGTYPIVPSAAAGSGLTNYSISYSNGTLTVLTGVYDITWTNPASIVYGTPLGTNENNAGATIGGAYAYSPTNGTVLPVGTNLLGVVFTPGDTNYASTNLSVPLVILPATLSVTANDANKVYGAVNPTFTASFSGFVNGENSGVLSGSPSLTASATTNSGVGTYPIVATNGTLSAANYVFSFVEGTLTIGQANLSVTADDQIKDYGTTLTLGAGQTAFTSTGLANGESIGSVTLTASGGTNAFDAPGVYTITPSMAAGGTFSLTNYNVSYLNGSLIVTQAVSADLAVFKSGTANGVAGSNLVYTITVTNLGPNTATNILVQDWLPSDFAFVSATPVGATVSNNVVTWSVATLAANAKTNFTVTARSLEGGSFTNIASATSDTLDPDPANSDGSSTNSQARTTVSALADVAVFKTGGTNAYAGGTANYTITVTNLGPSTASNVVVQDLVPTNTTFLSASGSYTVSNNIVSWDALTLSNGATASFTISLQAPVTGSFTNIALSTSPTADPNPTNNNGTAGSSRVATKTVPSADVIVLLAGPPSALQGSNFVYTIIVTNAGPSVSSNVVVSDSLPLGLTFISASNGGKNTNNLITWPLIKSLAAGGVTNYSLTVNAAQLGAFTNIASAVAVTYDPNPTNNSGVTPASRAVTAVGVAQFGILAGAPILNPQTGLYEETVTVTNNAVATILGFRLYVGGLTNGITLYNASGTTNGVPFVNYNYPLDPSNAVSLILEFYNPTRQAFTHTLSVEAISPANASLSSTNRSAPVSRVFADQRNEDMRFVIEFVSVPGKTYAVIYSSDLVTWKVATPSIKAASTTTQWYDDGPPKTESKPGSVSARNYRVIKFD